MEEIRILGVDPSLRFTGFCELIWNSEKDSPIKVSRCLLVANPQKYTKTAALMNMLMLNCEALAQFESADHVIVESPSASFNAAWATGSIITVGHIAGGAAVAAGLDKAILVRPVEWNRGQKKEKTHAKTEEILGKATDWLQLEPFKNQRHLEHILDAASMALWFFEQKYLEKEE